MNATYLQVGNDSQRNGGHVKRVGYKVQYIPHVAQVVGQTEFPELLDLTPDQPCVYMCVCEFDRFVRRHLCSWQESPCSTGQRD